MNITSVKPRGFANGFDFFCPDCGRFFSTQIIDDSGGEVEFCACCGESGLLANAEELLDYLDSHGADPVNFYHAFPPDEPIPNSRTGATPRQVKWIVGCVISDKQKKIPVTACSLAGQLSYNRELVAAVFDELHITETGGAG